MNSNADHFRPVWSMYTEGLLFGDQDEFRGGSRLLLRETPNNLLPLTGRRLILSELRKQKTPQYLKSKIPLQEGTARSSPTSYMEDYCCLDAVMPTLSECSD